MASALRRTIHKQVNLNICFKDTQKVLPTRGLRHKVVCTAATMDVGVFGMGCFWSPQPKFDAVRGVVETRVGYTGGSRDNPNYGTVCSSDGHTEAVRVTFDPRQCRYEDLLQVFLDNHDPSAEGRKAQYKSAIWTHGPEQAQAAADALARWERAHGGRKVATDVAPAGPWHDAEEYHQKYIEKSRSRRS